MSPPSSCIICLGALKAPVTLPCGHSFCLLCLERVIGSIRPSTTHHQCPKCRRAYRIADSHPSLVPLYLQHQVGASIRKLLSDISQPRSEPLQSSHRLPQVEKVESIAQSGLASPSSLPASPFCPASPREVGLATTLHSARLPLPSEEVNLREQCLLWRRRAELHAATSLGLIGLSRMARDNALQMRAERDHWEARFKQLQHSLSVHDGGPEGSDETAAAASEHSAGNSQLVSPPTTSPSSSPNIEISVCARSSPSSSHSSPSRSPTPPLRRSPPTSHTLPSLKRRTSSPESLPSSIRRRAPDTLAMARAAAGSDSDDEPPRKRCKSEDEDESPSPPRQSAVRTTVTHHAHVSGDTRQKARHVVATYLRGVDAKAAREDLWA